LATTKHNTKKEIETLELLMGAKFLRAYLECSDKIQSGIREMLDVLNDPETDEDEREMTLFTLADALFPNPHNGKLGMDLEESERMGAGYSQEARHAIDEMDREEESFAERLQDAMNKQGLTQAELAEKVGIQQPAISNMLLRQCRPQRRTVARFAEALGLLPDDLWPGFSQPKEEV